MSELGKADMLITQYKCLSEKIPKIKIVKNIAGCSLKQAKEYVELQAIEEFKTLFNQILVDTVESLISLKEEPLICMLPADREWATKELNTLINALIPSSEDEEPDDD